MPPLRCRGYLLSARNAAPLAKSKNATRGPQNGQWCLERGQTLGYWILRLAFFRENLKYPERPPGVPKMASRVWTGCNSLFFVQSHQLSQNRVFDLSTPSLRKVDDEGNGKKQGWGERYQKYIETPMSGSVTSEPSVPPPKK